METVRFTAEAQAEREWQMLWYDTQQRGLGETFDAAINSAVAYLLRHPQATSPYETTIYRKIPLPRPFQRFSLLYRERNGIIWIAAVWAGARDPDVLHQRLS